jgi:WD40 repeat protein
MVASSSAEIIKLWNAYTGEELQTLQGHLFGVRSLVFSPNSQVIASGSIDQTTKLWDVGTGAALRSFEHSDWVESINFSPDGLTLASGSYDKTMKLWNADTGQELQMLESHSAESIQSILGQISQTNNARVSLADRWVTVEGEKLLWLPFEYCQSTCFATEDGTLALGYDDGKVLILNFCAD